MKRIVERLDNGPEPRPSTVMRVLGLLHFALFYLWELLLANLRVAHDILTPCNRFRPGILHIPLPEMTDRQLIVLTNLVAMTPGTLSLDISEDRRSFYVHCMYIDDIERLRKEIHESYVLRIRRLF
jgi:multicomponent Na+:H+ antiporter subunit E